MYLMKEKICVSNMINVCILLQYDVRRYYNQCHNKGVG